MIANSIESRLLDRYERATRQPRLMMLYPPVSTGKPFVADVDAERLWSESPRSGTLYVHIPFCHRRCSFCPFYATVATTSEKEAYVENLLAEAALYASVVKPMRFSSVYLGGGTPSLLPASTIERLLDGLAREIAIDGADVTAEVNPATVDGPRLRELRAAGVTRVSIGIQSFNPEVLRASDRADTADRVLATVEAAQSASFRDVNVDLMYGLPEQTFAVWTEDLRTAARLAVPSLTLYSTVYLPAFQSRSESNGYHVASAAERLEMYDAAYDYLCGAGYPQPRFGAGAFYRSGLNPHRRNLSLGLPTLGLGTWAFSSSGPFAYHNRFPAGSWAEEVQHGRLPIRQLLVVPEGERARKYVIEALLLAYVSLDHFRELFGQELRQAFPAELAVLERLGLAAVEEGELRLTRKGGRHLREIRYLFASEAVVDGLERSGEQGL